MPRSKRKVRHTLSATPDPATAAMVVGLGVTNSLLLPVLGLTFPSFGDFLFRSVGLHWCLVLFAGTLTLMTILIGVSVHGVRKPLMIGLIGTIATIVPVLPWFDGCCAIYQAASADSGQVFRTGTFVFPLLTLAGHTATSIAVESNRRLLMRIQRRGASRRKSV
ncbi:MAG: MerC domain-containing protein [Planctomycetaceae bacterium]|nr:MerC domain-containing protein [Planctomycetaceae bacterium]